MPVFATLAVSAEYSIHLFITPPPAWAGLFGRERSK